MWCERRRGTYRVRGGGGRRGTYGVRGGGGQMV